MTGKIRVLHFGLGPIGCALARLALDRPGVEVVGAVEVAPDLKGRDLGDLLGDQATAAVAVNCAALVGALRPGPRTMLDVPLRMMP